MTNNIITTNDEKKIRVLILDEIESIKAGIAYLTGSTKPISPKNAIERVSLEDTVVLCRFVAPCPIYN